MSKYRLVLSRKAFKFLNCLDIKTRQRVVADFDALVDYPFWDRSLDIEKLEGQKSCYRLRTGKVIRTMFKIDKEAEEILVLKIAKRENAYE